MTVRLTLWVWFHAEMPDTGSVCHEPGVAGGRSAQVPAVSPLCPHWVCDLPWVVRQSFSLYNCEGTTGPALHVDLGLP